MMLRSTSDVPPPTVRAGLNRKPSAHWRQRSSTPSPSSMPLAPRRSLASPKTRWPWGSLSALRREASGPGFLFTAAEI